VMLVPVTMFFYITAMLNPIIKLKCVDNCRVQMRTEYDDDFGPWDDYAHWRGGDNVTLQSNGNVTLMRFNHGYVKCDTSCDDCEGKENVSETCTDYNDTEFQQLLQKLEDLRETYKDSRNYTLPYWLNPNCSCKVWCSKCDDQDYVALPGDGKPRQMQNYWNELGKHCREWEQQLNSTKGGEMCKLFDTFQMTMALTVCGILMLGLVLMLMMFMEYTNFHIFYGGRCKFCFISVRAKKVLFTVLLTVPVTFMLVVGVTLVYGNTDEMLNNYFTLIGANFELDWNTNGVYMFWISMALGILSILVMMISGKTTRHLRTIINYRRGVVYSDGNWKPHSS